MFKIVCTFYNYHNSGQYPESCLLLKNTTFRRLFSLSVLKFNLLSWAQQIKLVLVSGGQTCCVLNKRQDDG
jgi:hypothetical protein